MRNEFAKASVLIRSMLGKIHSKFFLPPCIDLEEFRGACASGFFNPTFLNITADSMAVICRHSYNRLSPVGFTVGAVEIGKIRSFLIVFKARGDDLSLEKAIWQPSLDGLEDVRLYPTASDKFFFAVQVLDAGVGSNPVKKTRSVPVVGTLSELEGAITIEKLAIRGPTNPVEKNWVFFRKDGRLSIEKFPGMAEFFHVDEESFSLTYEKTSSVAFTWSGTQSVDWGEGLLFLDHRRVKLRQISGSRYRYIYRFRFIEKNKTLISPSFSIGTRENVHYISDIKKHPSKDGIVIAVGKNDASCDFYTVRASVIENLLAQAISATEKKYKFLLTF